MRKDADAKDRDEGIASAISEDRSLTDALCSWPIPDEIVKVSVTTAISLPSKIDVCKRNKVQKP